MFHSRNVFGHRKRRFPLQAMHINASSRRMIWDNVNNLSEVTDNMRTEHRSLFSDEMLDEAKRTVSRLFMSKDDMTMTELANILRIQMEKMKGNLGPKFIFAVPKPYLKIGIELLLLLSTHTEYARELFNADLIPILMQMLVLVKEGSFYYMAGTVVGALIHNEGLPDDNLIKHNIIAPLTTLLSLALPWHIFTKAMGLLLSFARYVGLPSTNCQGLMLHTIYNLINNKKTFIIINTVESLKYWNKRACREIKCIIRGAKILPKLYPLLGHTSDRVKISALSTIMEILETNSEVNRKALVLVNTLKQNFPIVLTHKNLTIREKALLCFLDLIQFLESGYDVFLSNSNFFECVAENLLDGIDNSYTQFMGIKLLSSLVYYTREKDLEKSLKITTITTFTILLYSRFEKNYKLILRCFNSILKYSNDDDRKIIVELIRDSGCLEKIEVLESVDDLEVPYMATAILKYCF